MGNESFDAWVDLDSDNALMVRRVYGTNFDEPLARQSSSGTVQWYGRDHLGSVRQVFDNSTGSPVSTVEYDASGVVLSGTRVNRYGFTGREWDDTLGLQYSRARMYNPATGRWLQEDPLGHGAGDANLYRYVGNDPKNWIDPSGLAEAGGPGTQELIDWGTSLYVQYQQANGGSQSQGPRDPEVMLLPMMPDKPRYLQFDENFRTDPADAAHDAAAVPSG